jgi:hypothetical protein
MQKLIYGWLLLIGAGHVIAGVALPFLTDTPLFDPYLQLLQAHLGEGRDSSAAQSLLRLLVGLFGPTVASWGLLYCALLHLYRQHGLRLVKPTLYAALLLWCLLDSGLSARAGLDLNLYLNFGVALAIGIPLAFLQPRGRAA